MRLNQLFFLLGVVPPNKIKMSKWRWNNINKEDVVKDEDLMKSDCGTVACAVGYACLNPAFNKEGFSWNPETQVPRFENSKVPDGQKPIVNGSWGAVQAFFQLTPGHSHSLFDAVSTTEYRVFPDYSDRDIARHRLHSYLVANGIPMSVFQRIDV